MPCIYCLSDHAGDCPLDPNAAQRRCQTAAELALKHAETAVWAAARARNAAEEALKAAQMCEGLSGESVKKGAALAYRRAEEAAAAATLTDQARQRCVDAEKSVVEITALAQQVIKRVSENHARLRALLEQPAPKAISLG